MSFMGMQGALPSTGGYCPNTADIPSELAALKCGLPTPLGRG
jgi:hypothetical protein